MDGTITAPPDEGEAASTTTRELTEGSGVEGDPQLREEAARHNAAAAGNLSTQEGYSGGCVGPNNHTKVPRYRRGFAEANGQRVLGPPLAWPEAARRE